MGAPSNSIQRAQVRWGRHTSASSLLSTDVPLLTLGSLAIFFCLLPFRGVTSPSSSSWSVLLFFKFDMACRSRSVGGGGGGRTTGGCVLGASFEVPPLFLLANRPFKPSLFLQIHCFFFLFEFQIYPSNDQLFWTNGRKLSRFSLGVWDIHWLLRRSLVFHEVKSIYFLL